MERGTSIQILSDIHLEFPQARENIPKIPVLSPILALLGDIGNPMKKKYRDFLYEMADVYQHVIVVAGNHEYYCNTYSGTQYLIKTICEKRPNIHFLNGNTLDLDILEKLNIRIIGATLWTNIPEEHQLRVSYSLTDYKKVKICPDEDRESEIEILSKFLIDEEDDNGEGEKKKSEGERISDYFYNIEEEKQYPKWNSIAQNEINEIEVKFIQSEIQRAKEEGKKVVIFSHHAPTDLDTRNETPDSPFIRFIDCSLLNNLIEEENVICWAFGHTHYSCDQIIGNCRVISNQLGYVRRHDPCFDPTLCIPLDMPLEDVRVIAEHRSKVLKMQRDYCKLLKDIEEEKQLKINHTNNSDNNKIVNTDERDEKNCIVS